MQWFITINSVGAHILLLQKNFKLRVNWATKLNAYMTRNVMNVQPLMMQERGISLWELCKHILLQWFGFVQVATRWSFAFANRRIFSTLGNMSFTQENSFTLVNKCTPIQSYLYSSALGYVGFTQEFSGTFMKKCTSTQFVTVQKVCDATTQNLSELCRHIWLQNFACVQSQPTGATRIMSRGY